LNIGHKRAQGKFTYHLRMPTVTAQLLMALDTVAFELTRVETLISEEAAVNPNDASTIKRAIIPVKIEVLKLIEWLGTARLEDPRN
jgi:hypothetical protein